VRRPAIAAPATTAFDGMIIADFSVLFFGFEFNAGYYEPVPSGFRLAANPCY
jgi:hypothetical protein